MPSNEKEKISSGKRKIVTISLLASSPLLLTGCAELFAQEEITAYEECILSEEELGVDFDCEDDDSDWYKMKGYKSKKTKSAAYKSSFGSSKSGYGGSGYSSGG